MEHLVPGVVRNLIDFPLLYGDRCSSEDFLEWIGFGWWWTRSYALFGGGRLRSRLLVRGLRGRCGRFLWGSCGRGSRTVIDAVFALQYRLGDGPFVLSTAAVDHRLQGINRAVATRFPAKRFDQGRLFWCEPAMGCAVTGEQPYDTSGQVGIGLVDPVVFERCLGGRVGRYSASNGKGGADGRHRSSGDHQRLGRFESPGNHLADAPRSLFA